MKSYEHSAIEKKWLKKLGKKTYKTNDVVSEKENFYLLTEFPYPSGNLHVGHWYAFSIPDILARFLRMKGKNVLFPIGFDAFGLPAENAALKHGLNPRKWTEGNIAYMRKQLASMGASFDWSREVVTCTPEYYEWTQWLFLQLFKRGLAYRKKTAVNWCPSCKTVLANEQVKNEKCERCDTTVEQRQMEQWSMKITEYAERLLSDLKKLDWPEPIKEAQRNWIGKSEGALIKFEIRSTKSETNSKIGEIEIFTTRADTIFGASFVAIAPEHPLAKDAKNIRAINPSNNEELPIFVADYVLQDYGTGAVMGVPAHDERDHEFAIKNNLPIKEAPFATEVQLAPIAKKTISYKLRDWTVSRQRYWGVPIPVVKCEKCGYVPVREKDLPVKLPEIKDFKPTGDGKSPLAKVEKWKNVKCPQCGDKAERETDTLDTFVDSSWYFLRYTDPKNKKEFASSAKMKNWMPINFYSGGAEHTTMHLLYSRFWHKVLFDCGLVADDEPYVRRMNRGLILGPDGQKMSKSRGNVIDPDEQVKKLGADTVRMYLAFIGPYNEVGSYPWNPDGAVGVRRFLERVWRLQSRIQHLPPRQNSAPSSRRELKSSLEGGVSRSETEDVNVFLHQTIKKVSESIETFKMNTGVSALMILLNEFEKQKEISQDDYKIFLRLLAPFAPFITEELWASIGNKKSIHFEKWPEYDAKIAESETVTIVVQINGKVRGSFSSERGITESDAFSKSEALPTISKHISGKTIVKRVFVKDRLVNIVAN